MQREFVIQSAISGLKGTTKDKARVGRIFYDKLKARWYVFIIEDDNQFVVVVDRYFIASKYGYEYKLVVREGDEISYKDPIATDSFFTNGMPTYTMNYNILPNMTNITFDDAIEQTENFEASYYRYSTTIVQIDKDSKLVPLKSGKLVPDIGDILEDGVVTLVADSFLAKDQGDIAPYAKRYSVQPGSEVISVSLGYRNKIEKLYEESIMVNEDVVNHAIELERFNKDKAWRNNMMFGQLARRQLNGTIKIVTRVRVDNPYLIKIASMDGGKGMAFRSGVEVWDEDGRPLDIIMGKSSLKPITWFRSYMDYWQTFSSWHGSSDFLSVNPYW